MNAIRTTLWLAALLALAPACSKDKGDDSGTSGDTSISDDSGNGGGDDSGNGGDDTGTSNTGPTCDDVFEACGGDPSGSWSFTDVCMDIQVTDSRCPDATISVQSASLSGTADLDASGSFSLQGTISVTMAIHLPSSCLGNATCEQVAQASGMTCTDASDGCNCTQDYVDDIADTGTWTASGSEITFTPDNGGNANTMEFCAQDGWLELHQIYTDPDSTQDIRFILQKQ